MNKDKSLKKLRMRIEKVQDAKRFEHTLGVCYTAACLAMVHGADVRAAQIAGLLHDCAKCMSDKKRLAICEKAGLEVTDPERRNPFLLHAKVGAYLAETKYGYEDHDILNAVRYHTTGRPEMSLLEKIVFIADYLEPGRKQAPNLDKLRQLAFTDLDRTLCMILEDTLSYLKSNGGEIDPATECTYQYYSVEKTKEDKHVL